MMATVSHVTSGLGLRKFQADGCLLTRVYIAAHDFVNCMKIWFSMNQNMLEYV